MPEVNLYAPLDGLHPQEALPRIERVAGEAVPAPCRQLLVHEHDMTPTLAAFHQSEIGLRVLHRQRNGHVLFREVILLAGDEPVEFGAIAIHLSAFSEPAQADILAGHLPLGTVLAKHRVEHLSCPQAFLRIEANAFVDAVFGLALEPRVLYGRRNILTLHDGTLLADILEILPHAA